MSFAAVVERLQKVENPYPGLRHFDVAESHLFFGRDLQVAELVKRLERHRFVAVLGMSGSGKSSLVRAGLIPALERGGVWEAGRRWRRVIMEPAGNPFERLSTKLAQQGLDASRVRESSHGLIQVARQLRDDESLLLVVDQFEELFRYKDVRAITDTTREVRDRMAAEATEFVQLLLEASRHFPPIYVVLTMRSDYLGDCAEFRDLPETLNECQYLVPRMTRPQRKEAIEGPLGRAQMAPSLVQRLLNDAGEEPDQLPVLQHALMRTWVQWRKSDPNQQRRIELQDYEAIGGFHDALNLHADELLGGVNAEIAKPLFQRLTARGRSNRERRDPAKLAELWAVCGATTEAQQQEVTEVIDRFRQGEATFLRPLAGSLEPGSYVDITHESLIRLWKKLRDEWLPEEERSAKTLFEVVGRARNWKARTGALLTGLDLTRVEKWNRTRNVSVAWAQHYVDEGALDEVRAFIKTSRRRRTRQRAIGVVAIVLAAAGGGRLLYERWARTVEDARDAQALAQQAETLRAANERDLVGLQTALVLAQPRAVPPPPGPGPAPVDKRMVYIQVRTKPDAQRALTTLTAPLERAGFSVPSPEVLPTGPSGNEVRYFRAAERTSADSIAAVLKTAGIANTAVRLVPGFEASDRTPPGHFEVWLAPTDLLPSLVEQLNGTTSDTRRAAGGLLARDHRANPTAIGLVLDTLSGKNLPSLRADGRLNALFFLNRSERTAWTDEHVRQARDAIDRIRARDMEGTATIGDQTRAELGSLEQKLDAHAAGIVFSEARAIPAAIYLSDVVTIRFEARTERTVSCFVTFSLDDGMPLRLSSERGRGQHITMPATFSADAVNVVQETFGVTPIPGEDQVAVAGINVVVTPYGTTTPIARMRVMITFQ